MSLRSKWASLVGLTLVAAALVVVTARTRAADEEEEIGQLFELRVYTAAPGKLEALHARFRDHAVPMFKKHGIRSVGYWTAIDGEHKGKLYYILAYPDRAAREKMLINGIAKDPAFVKAVAESEKDGKLTTAVESVLMRATDYSPIR